MQKGFGAPSEVPLTVLLVEDDADDVDLFRWALRRHRPDCSLWTAVRFAEVCERLEKGDLPDLVVMDNRVLDATSPEMLAWMRAQPNFNRLPVAVLSGAVRDREALLGAGAWGVFEKPYDLDEYIQVVEEMLALIPPKGPPAG